MRNFHKIPQFLAIILVASMTLAGTSCKKKKDNPPEPDTPPTLPPIESLRMDFSDFQSRQSSDKSSDGNYVNYNHAYDAVSFWEALLNDDLLAIPIAGFTNALSRTGQEESSGTFEWSLNFSAQAINYVGTLVAVKGATSFTMELYAAPQSSPSSTFKYFDATVSNDLSSVDWNIFKNSGSSVKVLDGSYSMNETSGFESLMFTYVEAGQTETNSSVEYNYTPGVTYDAAYYMTMSAGAIDVEWNTSSKSGRIMSFPDYGDTDWHNWNDVLVDI